MVRDYGLPIQNTILLLLETGYGTEEADADCLDALAEAVRRTYARFPRVVRIVFDHRGLGDAFPQFLAQPWTDEKGKEYPPWTLDDERTIIHNAVPMLRSVKANAQINQQLVSCLRVA